MSSKQRNRVEAIPNQSQDANSTPEDIWNFISEDQWPILVAALLTDNAEKLRRLIESSGIDWRRFLASNDTKGRKRHCPERFRSYDRTIRVSRLLMSHPYPSNPFLLAVMYDARNCCQLMRETTEGLELSSITEIGFTSYHTLFAGLDIMKAENEPIDILQSRSQDYLKYFLNHFFSTTEVTWMSTVRNTFHMRPLEWGIYCGYVDIVDELLYRSHVAVVHCDMSGLMEHVEMDFTEVVTTEAERSVALLSVISEVFGESRVSELGVFRRPLVLAPLVDESFSRHRFTMALLCLFTLLDPSLLLGSCDAEYRNFVATACCWPRFPRPRFFLTVRCVLMIVRMLMLFTSLFGRLRKNSYRSRVGFPDTPRKADRDSLVWMVSICLSIITDVSLIALLSSPDTACSLFGADSYRPFAGSLVLIGLLLLVCILMTNARLLPVVSKFFNSFYRSFAMFANFIIIYLLMLVTFSRIFQVVERSVQSSSTRVCFNNTVAEVSLQDSDAFSAIYRTFLLTLNVFDTTAFQPTLDRTDLILAHMAFILLVPVMFINFVVGVLSSVVGTTMQFDVECRYLLKLSFSEYCETTLFWLFKLWELVAGKRRLVLSICRPLTKNSRSVCNQIDSPDYACV